MVARYTMGKKNKHKLRKSKENEASDSSEDVAARGCPHVSKSINFSAMKKGLGKQAFGECAGCAKESSKRPSQLPVEDLEGAVGSDFLDPPEPVLWVCLQCGNQGCGRASQEKHALKHYETPRSSQHNVVINTTTWSAWCYECDDEIAVDKYKKVSECMEHLKKLACVPLLDGAQGKNGSGSGGASSSADAGINKGRPQSGKGASGYTCLKVKGLSNLGNTCFFNAVMQNLIQTYSLENLLGERKKAHQVMLTGKPYLDGDSASSSEEGEDENNKNNLKELPSIEINISDPGPLTHSLVVFLYEMNSSSRSNCINPSALFGQVCKKAPRFKGMQQQDSHELLRYLLDNMKTEEIKRGQTGILKYFKISDNVNTKKVDEEVKGKVKAYGRQVKHTFVECLFGGQLISTIVCEECKYISQILEPFLDLSLPVTEEKPQRPSQSHSLKKKEGSFGSKEEVSASKGKEEEKPSKHQSKKQKKKAKREAKLGSKNKIVPADSLEKENGEEEGEKEEKEDGERKSEEQEEKYDASDADVEDNLESDTSRCFNNIMTDSNATMDDSTIMEIIPEASTTNQNSGYKTESQSTVFNVVYQSSSLDDVGNGPIGNSVTESKDSGEDVTVSFTICEDGQLKEEKPQVSAVCEVHNGFNGMNGNDDSEVFEDFEFIDAPSPIVEFIDTAKAFSVRSSIQNSNSSSKNEPVTYATNSVTENFTMVEKSSITNDVNVAVEIPVAQRNGQLMNGNLVNGIGSSTDSEKMDTKNATLFSASVDIIEHVNEITDGVNSVHIVDETPVTLSLPNEISKLTLDDVKNKNANTDAKSKTIANTIGSSQTSIKHDEIKAPVVKSEEFHDEDFVNVENGDVASKQTASHAVPNSPNMNTHHAHSNLSRCHSASAKHNRSWKEIQKEGQHKSVNTLRDRYHPNSGECSIESCLHQFTAAELLTGNNKFGCKNCTRLSHKQNPNREKKECVYSNASKQYLIFQPPAVLTLHLKRFEQVGYSSRKVNRHVEFPFVLDIASYCSSLSQGIKSGQKKVLYSLYGVVEHSGRLTSGHYTAYVKVRANIGTLTNFLNFHNVTVKEYLHRYAQSVVNGDRLEADAADDSAAEALVPPGRWYHISDSRVNEVTEASVERAQAYLLFYERIY